jgi:MFS family permease
MNVLRQLRALPRAVRVLFAAMLVNRAGTMVLPYLAIYITEGLGAGAEAAGTVLAAYGIGAVVAPTLSGRLVDRFGAVSIMRSSLIGSGLLLLLYPFATGTSTLIALTFALSLVAEAFRPASLAVVADAVPAAQRKTAFAVLRFAINLGVSIGPAVGGLLVAVSFRALFYIDGGTSIAAGALLAAARWSDSGKDEVPDTSIQVAATATTSSVAAQSGGIASGAASDELTRSDPRHRRAFAMYLAGALLLSVVFFQFESSLPLFVVRELHASEALYGSLITINAVIIIFTEIPLNLRMDAWPHTRSMTLGAALFAVGFGMLAFGKSPAMVIASVPIWTAGEMIALPAASAFVSDLAPPGRTGSYMGLSTTAFGLGFAVGPFLGIYALEHFGSTTLWGSIFVVGAAATLIFASLSRFSAPSPRST